MSVHRLSAGNGFRYLLRDTASADVPRDGPLRLTEYYAASGNPPGRWLGSGLAGLADGAGVREGTVVSEAGMTAVFGHAADPVTGTALGRSFATRVGPDGSRRLVGVAGYDLTFTVPKSVSVVWALGDEQTRAKVTGAHHAAVAQVLRVLEARVVATRVGHAGASRVTTRGVVAAAFDHPDTRAGDPNLHTHVVVANRVQGPDQEWRTIDGQLLFAAAVTLSETYDALLADELTRRLPVSFGWRDRGLRRTAAFEVDGVDDQLLALFSTRSRAITAHLEELVSEFTASHERGPSRVETIRLRQTATLATRQAKQPHAWADLLTSWAQRARVLTGREPRDLLTAALDGDYGRPLCAHDVGRASVTELAALAVVGVGDRRSTWNGWNLEAEIARLTKHLPMASARDRASLHAAVLSAATAGCVPLHDPDVWVDRWPGMSRRWTSTAILDAETRLLAAATTGRAPAVGRRLADAVSAAATSHEAIPESVARRGLTRLAEDQGAAMVQVVVSGHAVDVLVGPAGSGKTSTLRAVKVAWELSPDTTDVVGLAPSATAAHQLSQALGVRCETAAKWLHESLGPAGQHRLAAIADAEARLVGVSMMTPRYRDLASAHRKLVGEALRWRLNPGQLLIIDEASLAGTLDLDHLVTQAQTAGAKVLLVGDHHQLSAVQASGAFGLLARRTQTAELTGLWRFQNRWEAQATRGLRHGDPTTLDAYDTHDRLHQGWREDVLDSAYTAWRTDLDNGLDTLLIAVDQATVTDLNTRARSEAITAGHVSPAGVNLVEGTTAGIGDRIITRSNHRGIPVGRDDHVHNGDTWTITALHPDGALTAQLLTRADPKAEKQSELAGSAPIVRLPADYVAEHVDLGYAITAQRVQSRTVDTTHVITGPGMTREHLYVTLTRGRTANHAYTPLDGAGDSADEAHRQATRAGTAPTSRELLEQILATSSAEPSATESLPAQHRPQPTQPGRGYPQNQPRRSTSAPSQVPDGPGLSR